MILLVILWYGAVWDLYDPRTPQYAVYSSGGHLFGAVSQDRELLSGDRAEPYLVICSFSNNVVAVCPKNLPEFTGFHVLTSLVLILE